MRKKIDNRIRVMIENGMATKHRSIFVIVGDHGRDQVVILHHMLSKAVVKARPSVLWCYKKELGFSSHRKKRMRQLQKRAKSGKLDMKEDDPFELFITATNIRYCYYHETHNILGNTYGMCVLQDFEALTPNLMARTIETVEGGGLVVLLLKSMQSLKQLYTMSMDVHARYRTEAHQDVVGRFNERFLLSLTSCKNCAIIDDQLNLLPLTSHALSVTPLPPKPMDGALTPAEEELRSLQEALADTQPVGALVRCARTVDQARALLKFIEAISEKTLRSTVTMTAARGRGKSAALGLAMAGAVGFGYCNIFVTSPSPENLKTLFEFVFKGFDAMEYQEHLDYELVQSTNPEFNKAIVRVNIFREHRQTIQYIMPGDAHKLGQAELVCIDEAAAIPLPLVKALLGPYLVFMSSTINGYEGTGRSLSLKLIQQLRQQSATFGGNAELQKAINMAAKGDGTSSATGRMLHEVALKESIRYASDDPVERWLNDLLCLDAGNVVRISSGCPAPSACDLYYVNRDTLFSYHKASEAFLQRLMGLYVASHYKNSPNDLQMLSDAPAHHIFCLLGPVSPSQNSLPEVLCVLQVCLEGEITQATVLASLARGKRAAGDLIPWTISQQFQDADFPTLSGARVVRIATHPDYQGMGYGTRALHQLKHYYENKIPNLSEDAGESEATVIPDEAVGLIEERLAPRRNLPPLLLKLTERQPEALDYLGVSYGMTPNLLRFWKRAGYTPVYLRQTANDLTGEHSCIMLTLLNTEEEEGDGEEGGLGAEPSASPPPKPDSWLHGYWQDFRRRFLSLLSYQFRAFTPALSLSILQQKAFKQKPTNLTVRELDAILTRYDVRRLELYAKNMVDYHLIMDLLPAVSRLYFLQRVETQLSAAQAAIILALGLQHKTVEDTEKDLHLPASQILGLFNRAMRKLVAVFSTLQEDAVARQLTDQKEVTMEPVAKAMDQELDEAAAAVEKKQRWELKALQGDDLAEFSIRGSEAAWTSALSSSGQKDLLSVRGAEAKKRPVVVPQEPEEHKKKKMKRKQKH